MVGTQKFAHQATRSGDHVRSSYVSTQNSGPVVSGGLAGTCDHCRDDPALHHRLAGLHLFPEWRKMVGTSTKKEWAYA